MKVKTIDNQFLEALKFHYGVDGYTRAIKQDNEQDLNVKQYCCAMFGESKTKQEICNVVLYALSFSLQVSSRDISIFSALTQSLKKYAAEIQRKKQNLLQKLNEIQDNIKKLDTMNDDLMKFIADVSAEKEKFKDKI